MDEAQQGQVPNGEEADRLEQEQLAADEATRLAADQAAAAAAPAAPAAAREAADGERPAKRPRKAAGDLSVSATTNKRNSEDLQRELLYSITHIEDTCCAGSPWVKFEAKLRKYRNASVVKYNDAGDAILLCYSYKHQGDIEDVSTPFIHVSSNARRYNYCNACVLLAPAPVAAKPDRFA